LLKKIWHDAIKFSCS